MLPSQAHHSGRKAGEVPVPFHERLHVFVAARVAPVLPRSPAVEDLAYQLVLRPVRPPGAYTRSLVSST